VKVSVLIACYNYAEFIGEAVDSVLAQDYGGPLELVVVDDGSTDGSGDVLASYGDRIVSLGQENRGQAAAFNSAYNEVTGDVICFLDADDFWRPDKVRRVVEAFSESSGVGLIHHELEVVDRHGQPLDGADVFPFKRANGDVRELMRKTVLDWHFMPTSGFAVTREIGERIFPLREQLKSSADELIAPSAALVTPVKHLADRLGAYRIHGSNIWAASARREEGGLEAKVKRARDYVTLLDEKVAQGTRVLKDSGEGPTLSPWVKWQYVRARAVAEGYRPIRYLPQAARTTLRCPHFSPSEKTDRLAFMLRKSIKYHERARLLAGPWLDPQKVVHRD
jgi:glycosyltransferase involved in cell wall biosynthesis